MTDWDELVTVALLGTDRRPVPDELRPRWSTSTSAGGTRDAASVVLALAAAHRALTEVGPAPAVCAGPELAPGARLPLAAERAQELLAGLLARPEPVLVNAWLTACADRGLGAAPDHWPRLAQLASRNTAYDRQLLGRVLGPRGLWFVTQHPQWARLATTTAEPSVTVAASTPPGPTTPAGPSTPPGPWGPSQPASSWRPFEQRLVGGPALAFDEAVAALRLIAGGSLGAGARNAAALFAERVPLDVWAALAEWASHQHPEADAIRVDPSPVVQLALATMQRTVAARLEIDQVFTADPTGEKP